MSGRRLATLVLLTAYVLVVVLSMVFALGVVTYPPGRGYQCGLLLVLVLLTILLDSVTQASEREEASRMVDVGPTAALALAISHALPGGPVDLPTSVVTAVVAAGLVLGGMSCAGGGPASAVRQALPRVVVVALLSFVLRDWRAGQGHVLGVLSDRSGTFTASVLLLLVLAALVVEAPLRAELWRAPEVSRREAHRTALRESLVLGIVPASTAVLVAMAQPVLGLPSLPVILLPLVFNQIAMRRHEEMRRNSRESVVALSRMPEAMGLVRPGHADRVARTAADIGRELGLARAEVARVHRAALLHDIGQVRPGRGVPSGATLLAAPADQSDIAAEGAAIARATGVLDAESEMIAAQSLPYRLHASHARQVPLGSRIIKVANAYDDLVTGESTAALPLAGPDAALERLWLGLGHEYDPRVVDALEAVVHGVSGVSGGRAADGVIDRT